MTRAALMFALLAVAAPARAQSRTAEEVAREGLADAERRYADLDYQGAVEALTRVLALSGARDADRLEAFEYLGACYVILEREPEAREAFTSMLRLDPYHVLREPTGSPKIARLVAELRTQLAPDAALDPAVRLVLSLPRAARVGAPSRATVRVEGGTSVARVTVFVRGAADEAFDPVDTTRDGATFVATLPARDAPDELEVYAEARDAQERVVARAGEPLTPASLPVRGEPGGGERRGGDVTSEWWFWAIIGGAVAIVTGVVVGLAVGTRQSAPEGSLPPGRVMLPLVSF